MSDARKERDPRSLKSTLIEPFKQIKLGVYVLILTLIFVALLSYLIGQSIWLQYSQVMEIFKVIDQEAQRELVQNDVTRAIAIKLGMAISAYVMILFAMVFYFTHRIYGPLISIGRFVESITDGDYDARVQIREKDELNQLVSQLNKMAQTLQKRHYSGDGDRRSQVTERRQTNSDQIES